MKLSGVHLGTETRVSWLFITGWKWKMGLIQVWEQAASSQEASDIVPDAVWGPWCCLGSMMLLGFHDADVILHSTITDFMAWPHDECGLTKAEESALACAGSLRSMAELSVLYQEFRTSSSCSRTGWSKEVLNLGPHVRANKAKVPISIPRSARDSSCKICSKTASIPLSLCQKYD